MLEFRLLLKISIVLETQIESCKELCSTNNYAVYNVYTDDPVSGSIEPNLRPAMKQLISDATNKKFSCVVFYSVDRLSRDTYHTVKCVAMLKSIGISILLYREKIDVNTYQGKFKLSIFASFAELELEYKINKRKTKNGINNEDEIKLIEIYEAFNSKEPNDNDITIMSNWLN